MPRAAADRPWPGQLPQPAPAVLLDDPVELLDSQGNPVRVTVRGMFTAEPVRLDATGSQDRGELSWWAGPWPVDERWWDPGQGGSVQSRSGRSARAQILVADTALLLCYRQRRWYLEGVYE